MPRSTAKKASIKAKSAKRPSAKQGPPDEPEYVLMLRTCSADMTSYNKFRWPTSGYVEAPDWDGGQPVCGGKLHGFLWGEGDGDLASWAEDAKWLCVRVDPKDMICLGNGRKYGFRCGDVVFCGSRLDATNYIATNGGGGKSIVGGTATAGDGGTATAGYSGTATAGDRGTATAGYSGTATAGDSGTATAGDSGTATAGDRGTATAGDSGTATAGDGGTATAGDGGTATAGYSGTATAGYSGTATAGYSGTATAGDRGILTIKWYDENSARYRIAIGYVGEGGIEAGAKYEVRDGKIARKA